MNGPGDARPVVRPLKRLSAPPRATDLYGQHRLARRVRVYVDESKPTTTGSKWLYIGLVIVDEDDLPALCQQLNDDRDGYDNELHFIKITQHHKADVARRWLNRAMCAQTPTIRFHVLGIDTDKLQQAAFGVTGADQRRNRYTRFFRTAVTYAVKSLCDGPVVVTKVVHDHEGQLAGDDTFDWHSVWRMRADHDLPVLATQVTFTTSDHNAADGDPIDSTLIQLTDVILGASRLCLDGTSGKQHQVAVAEHFLPLVKRLTDDRLQKNRNSSYGYVGRCSMSFFPKTALTVAELDDPEARYRSGFYKNRRPALGDAQLSLGI